MVMEHVNAIYILLIGAAGASGAGVPEKKPVTVLDMSDTLPPKSDTFCVAWPIDFVADASALPSSCSSTFSTGSMPGTLSIRSFLNWASCLD